MSEHYDVLIVGGGVMGAATSFFLSRRYETGRVLVIEKDRTYARASSTLSTSGFRQQFSTAVNVQMARFSADFILDTERWLGAPGENAGINVHEAGYLYLGSEAQVDSFNVNNRAQRALGVDVLLLDRKDLSVRFPWLDLEGIAIGSLGLRGEGWFDGYLLMNAFHRAARRQGVMYHSGEVALVAWRDGGPFEIALSDGRRFTADRLVNTAGTGAPLISRMLGFDTPVSPIKQTVFGFSSPHCGANMPYLFTPTGLFCRPAGADFIGGIGIADNALPVALDDFTVDHTQFEDEVWPRLAQAVPAFREARCRSAWAGHYDMSTFDHNPFIGAASELPGYYMASGFSGHGLMQSPAVGLALSELIIDGAFKTLDLGALSFSRIAQQRPVREAIQY